MNAKHACTYTASWSRLSKGKLSSPVLAALSAASVQQSSWRRGRVGDLYSSTSCIHTQRPESLSVSNLSAGFTLMRVLAAGGQQQRQVQQRATRNNSSSNQQVLQRPVRPSTAVRMSAKTPIPKIVAFDLDGTMWYPEMYQLSGGAPFRRDASGAVYDRAGERIKLLGDTMKIIQQITMEPEWADTQIAFVSRTEYPEWAIPCLQQFPIPGHPRGLTLYDVGMYQEIYPGSKLKHFKVIHQASGVDYEDMLFFDNERWNITEVSRLGVKSVYTPRGMTSGVWQQGLQMCAEGAEALGSSKQKQKQQKSRVSAQSRGY